MWLLEDSTVDALELPDELKLFARQMAGESEVDLTSDRERILLSAALETEMYVGKMYFRGAAGSARACTSIVSVDGPGSVPAIPQFPRSTPVNITSVMRWDDAAAAFVTSEYVARPLGAIRVTAAGTYRLLASATPNPNYPTIVGEAVARLFAFRENVRPRMVTGDMADGTFSSQAGGVLKSGAAELLRFVRIPGA